MTESSRRATCHTRSPRHDRETRLLRTLFGDHVIVAVGDLAVHQLAHLAAGEGNGLDELHCLLLSPLDLAATRVGTIVLLFSHIARSVFRGDVSIAGRPLASGALEQHRVHRPVQQAAQLGESLSLRPQLEQLLLELGGEVDHGRDLKGHAPRARIEVVRLGPRSLRQTPVSPETFGQVILDRGVLLVLVGEILDDRCVERPTRRDLHDAETILSLHHDVESAVGKSLQNLDHLRPGPGRPHPVVVCEDEAELTIGLQAFADQFPVSLLEDVQGEALGGKQYDAQGKQADLGHHPKPRPQAVALPSCQDRAICRRSERAVGGRPSGPSPQSSGRLPSSKTSGSPYCSPRGESSSLRSSKRQANSPPRGWQSSPGGRTPHGYGGGRTSYRAVVWPGTGGSSEPGLRSSPRLSWRTSTLGPARRRTSRTPAWAPRLVESPKSCCSLDRRPRRCSGRRSERWGQVRFNHTLDELGRALVVTHFGTEDQGTGWPAAVLELTAPAFSLRKGRRGGEEARLRAAGKFIDTMIMVEPKELARAFGWSAHEAAGALETLVHRGQAVRDGHAFLAPQRR